MVKSYMSVRHAAGLPPFGGPGSKLVHRRLGVDPVCGPRPKQVFGL